MQSGALQPSIANSLSKERLLAILISENYSELQIFIDQYLKLKQHNPLIEDYFNILINEKRSAFAIAAIKNNILLMKMLITAGANPNLQFANGSAAIHLAVINNRQEALEFLISIKVDLDLKSLADGITAMMYAALSDNDLMIKLLVNAKANINLTNSNGFTATLIATVNNKLKALQALIDAKADIDIATNEGFAPVHMAAEDNYYEALEKLINANADINACTKKLNYTALFVAVNNQHIESVKIILACSRTDLNLQCMEQQRTAIFHAVCVVNPEIFELLLAHRADPYIPAFINDLECSLRRLAKSKSRENNTPELNKILTLINNIPKFPTYENGINFVYHSVNKPGSEPEPEPDTLNVAETTSQSFNSRFTPGYSSFNLNLLRGDMEIDMDRMFNIMRTNFISNSLSFNTPRTNTRKKSFCSYDSNDSTSSTHVKTKVLGKGSYGSVNLMNPNTYGEMRLAVKEIPPPLRYASNLEDDYISIIISERYPDIAREAHVNYVIHGVGSVYCDQKLIGYKFTNEENIQSKILTAYPRCYIAMKYFDGQRLTVSKITSDTQYLAIFIDLLQKLKIFHEKFIHGDIKPDNIILNGENISLVDFSLSRPAGQNLYLKNLNLVNKPPEFKNKVFIKVAANQDIFCTGLVLGNFYSQTLFTKEIGFKIREVYMDMLKENPENRSTIESAIDKLITLQKLVKREKFLLNIFSSDVSFIREIKKIAVMDQLSFLNELDMTAVRKLFKDLSKFLSLFEAISVQNHVGFLKLMGDRYLKDLNIDFFISDLRSKQLPKFLQQGEVAFGKLFLETMITKIFEPFFNESTFRRHDLNQYITNSNNEVSVDFTNTVLKNIILNYMKNNNMNSCLKVCDNFKSSPKIYKQLLLVVNEVYREGRAADPREYFTFFGRYSKNDKVQASLALKQGVQTFRPDMKVFELGALNQGNLGQIAQRLRRCS